MQKNKNRIVLMLVITLMFNFLPTLSVKASDDMKIISSTSITVEQAKAWAKEKGATSTFISLADLYWKYASSNGGVNPGVAYVQAAKETGYGKFGGVIDESYHNPCGLKTKEGSSDTDPNAHQRFNNWDEGVQAHLDHLALYAGASGYPRSNTYDPRHFSFVLGKAPTVVALGGNWAPSSTYGSEVLSMYRQLESTIPKLSPLIELDAPLYGTNVSGSSLEVKGWALNQSGVKAINIYVDSKLIKSTTTGISRTDVKNVYPSYNDAKSGYSTSIDLSSVAAGKRTLTVEQVGNDGSKKSIDTIINVSKLASVSAIDTPASSSTITSNKVTVSGWAVSASGVKEIKVYVDGKEKGTTKVGISRTDIGNIYSAYPNASKSGFSVNIDINDIAPGNKTFEIKETSNDGSVHSTYVKANIVKKSPITVIDTPTDNYLEKNDTIKVTGWALNASGISNINVYVDGNKKASVKPTISRQDVINVYPGYQTNNVCGYTTSVSLAGLVAGSHKILVEAVGVDGTINTVSKNIYYKENPSKLIVLDPGHNHGGDDGAYSTHNGVRYSERDINMDIAMKTKAALEAKGYRVVLTRTPFDIEYLSVNDSLTKRVELANSLNADLFISIHQNSFDKESANGTEVYYTTKSNDSGFPASPNKAYKLSTSKTLANNIVNNISSIGFTNRGAKDGNLFVVRNTIMPAVLVECGFISNLKDVTNLTNSNIQEKIATAIANGVYGNF